MRKLLLLVFPVGIIGIISLSFYLLLNFDSGNFPIPQASAAKRHIKINRRIFNPTPTPTYLPTPTPTPTSIPTPTPTLMPTSTLTPTSAPITTPLPKSTTSDSVQSYILQKINDYRSSLGLSSVSTDPYTCEFAKVRAQEISTNFNHDGFTNRITNHTLPYPSYHQVTENIAMTGNYQEVVSMWINSPGHAENMRQDTPLVCVEKFDNYYAYEGWRR